MSIVKVRLTKGLTCQGREYPVDDVIGLPARKAKWLVEEAFGAEYVEDESIDDVEEPKSKRRR